MQLSSSHGERRPPGKKRCVARPARRQDFRREEPALRLRRGTKSPAFTLRLCDRGSVKAEHGAADSGELAVRQVPRCTRRWGDRAPRSFWRRHRRRARLSAGLQARLRPRPRSPAHCGEALASMSAHAHCGLTASPEPPGPVPGEPRAPAAGLPGRGGAAAAASDYL